VREVARLTDAELDLTALQGTYAGRGSRPHRPDLLLKLRRFADLKTHRGLQRFSGRSPARADAQVGLTVLVHNPRTLETLRIQRSHHSSLGK
jgi:hypothetical protein